MLKWNIFVSFYFYFLVFRPVWKQQMKKKELKVISCVAVKLKFFNFIKTTSTWENNIFFFSNHVNESLGCFFLLMSVISKNLMRWQGKRSWGRDRKCLSLINWNPKKSFWWWWQCRTFKFHPVWCFFKCTFIKLQKMIYNCSAKTFYDSPT